MTWEKQRNLVQLFFTLPLDLAAVPSLAQPFWLVHTRVL